MAVPRAVAWKASRRPTGRQPRELLAAYGENDLARQQIPLGSGTVKVQGSGIPAGHTVWVAGRQVPVDPQGNFAAEEILPAGAHTVEVAVLDDAGNGSLYLRDLEFKRTRPVLRRRRRPHGVRRTARAGRSDLLQGENAPQPYDSSLDGRLAFYVNGKVSENWRLTASADTREGPVKDLFSNFLDKSPDSLFRRIDPDYSLPDVRRRRCRGRNGADPGQVLRQSEPWRELRDVGQLQGRLPGQRAGPRRSRPVRSQRALRVRSHHQLRRATARAWTDSPPQPGTMPSYEEFRGTGGSLYFLHHQDILTGSERVRIEIRDKDSRHRHGGGQPAARRGLRHRLPAGPAAAFRAALVDRRRQPAGAQQRLERRRGLPGGALRVHARFRQAGRESPSAARAITGSTTTCGSA